jgi:hypothetical protein
MKTYTFKVIVEPDEDAQGNPAWHAYCPTLVSEEQLPDEPGKKRSRI